MNISWRPIDQLPDVYRTLVNRMIAANTDLVRAGIGGLRRPGLFHPSLTLIGGANVRTRVYVITTDQEVRFLFFRAPAVEDIVLQLGVDFEVRPLPALSEPIDFTERQVRTFLRVPPFLAGAVSEAQRKELRRALGLGQSDDTPVVYLRMGSFLLATMRGDDADLARAAVLLPGAAQAEVAFQRIASTGAKKYTYMPRIFLLLLEEIAAWSRASFEPGEQYPVPVPSSSSALAAQRLLAAVIGAWKAGNHACLSDCSDELVLSLARPLRVRDYRAEVILRLQPDGSLAEKVADDTFRLRMSVGTAEVRGEPVANVSLGPPDFLSSGKLRDRLLERLADKEHDVFEEFDLPDNRKEVLSQWMRSALSDAIVFRAEKDRDEDTDVFVLRADWEGVRRTAAFSSRLEIEKVGDDYRITKFDSPEVIYTDIPGAKNPLDVRFPRYFLTFSQQLGYWYRALGRG